MYSALAHTLSAISLDSSVIGQLIAPFEAALRSAPYYPLDALPETDGYGIYLIYLMNPEVTPYADLLTPMTPVYVGKASPAQRTSRRSTGALASRLRKHASSIEAAENLASGNFLCRVLRVEDAHADFVGVIESHFIQSLQPVWNTTITGFGINAPGKGRTAQSPSAWDTLHPGRSFAQSLTGPSQDVKTLMGSLRRPATQH